MEFEILGPLRVIDGSGPVKLTSRRRRILLLALLSHPNSVVPTVDLVAWLWPNLRPRAAVTTLHAHVSMLRSSLEPCRAPWRPAERLRTQTPGYVLEVHPDELDALRFERLVREARQCFAAGDAETTQQLLTEGLSLWRGAALADAVDVDPAGAEIARLEELRLSAVALRVEANLALDRHHEIVPELTHLVAKHPLDERFSAQLMVALCRIGRRADALAVYRRARTVLARELAVAPGVALRRAEAAILAGELE